MVHCYTWRVICSSLFLEVCSLLGRTRGMGFGLLNVVHNYVSLKYTEVNQGCSDAKSCMHADIVSFNAFENWCNFQGWNKSSVLVSWINATCDCPIVQYLAESYGEWITVAKTSLRATHFNPPTLLHTCTLQVRVYLTSKSWDTRIAAGQAVEAIARNVKKWQPSYQPKVEGDSPPPDPSDNLLAFDSFNIRQVLCLVFSILKVNPSSKYFYASSNLRHTVLVIYTLGQCLCNNYVKIEGNHMLSVL